ncbi:relaxase/mobilization nuclease domain-containing protein [Ruminococcus sp.]|uniref:relaxase/mobilization nuclease domain-containing protein n=1 Tax=Ruminococcus sp. TaxID=41978 RepID=UPI0025EBA75B|nr:relaxase/mobilization nuclease domain-containing protein [Ruminococcus sp.]
MAYIGKASIKCYSHMENAIGYIAKQEKAMPLSQMKKYLEESFSHLKTVDAALGERTSFINCIPQTAYMDFEIMRKVFDQDKGIIAHHYYQSFQKDDNVTPEQAHKIGVELAKKMFPNFQVAIATHIDREHIHNHILVNSVNIMTGQKWYSNKRSLSDIRRESDRLCLENGLGVIKKNNKYQGIDRTTYQLGLKGKSWKINLVHDLDKAIGCCKSKDEFISFLNEKDYTVRYTDNHITITKNGEKKGIRVDTLARQFGSKYTKESLERNMGYYTATAPKPFTANNEKRTFHSSGKSNWEYYEQNIFRQNGCFPSTSGNIVRDYNTERLISAAKREVLYSHNIFDFVLKAILWLTMLSQRRKKKAPPVRYRKVGQLRITKPKPYFIYGNISYRELKETSGDTYSIKVGAEMLLNMIDQPILYSAKVSRVDGSVTITIKDKDRKFLLELLEMQSKSEQLDDQSQRIKNQLMYKELKETAAQNNEKLQYLVITAEQKKILEDNCIKFAYFDKGDRFNVAFLPEKAELIKKLIYPSKDKQIDETPQKKNAWIYDNLKKNAALSGEKLRYKAKLTKAQLDTLINSDILFAYFTNKEDKSLYNIAYESKDEDKIREVLTELNNYKAL